MKLEGIGFSYGNHRIFEGFSWQSDAEVIQLTGPAGCGKTTLLRLLAGHLLPTVGQVPLGDNDACLLLQEDGLFPWLTGLQNVSIAAAMEPKDVEAHPLFPRIAGIAPRFAFEMSFGQRRTVELVRALMTRPRLLLLDEPFNFLDRSRRAEMALALAGFVRDGGRIVVTTHYADELLDLKPERFEFDGSLPVRRLAHT